MIAAWDGSIWTPLGAGLSGQSEFPCAGALCQVGTTLMVGGDFDHAGGTRMRCLAQWNDLNWAPVGTAPPPGLGTWDEVCAIAVYKNQLFAGGYFQMVGQQEVHFVARWDGSSWHDVGGGVQGSDFGSPYVAAFVVADTSLIMAGSFLRAGNMTVDNIVRWDDEGTWHPLGSGLFGGPANALAYYDGKVIAGGYFNYAGNNPAFGIAQWDGTQWSSVGQGLGGPAPWCDALVTWNGSLIAGGTFTLAGSVQVAHIARWDGTTWWPMGGGLGGGTGPQVSALVVYNGVLYAGGRFVVPGRSIASWDGSVWTCVGGGMGGYEQTAWVRSLACYQGRLIAGGESLTAGGAIAKGIASWDGTSWRPFGGGIDGPVEALCPFRDNLYAGGFFHSAGGVPSYNIARWIPDPSGAPVAPPATSRVFSIPNPYRAGASIRVAGSGTVNARIFDLSGRCLRAIEGETGEVRWDGRNEKGAPVPAGVYFIRAERGAAPPATARFVLIHE